MWRPLENVMLNGNYEGRWSIVGKTAIEGHELCECHTFMKDVYSSYCSIIDRCKLLWFQQSGIWFLFSHALCNYHSFIFWETITLYICPQLTSSFVISGVSFLFSNYIITFKWKSILFSSAHVIVSTKLFPIIPPKHRCIFRYLESYYPYMLNPLKL